MRPMRLEADLLPPEPPQFNPLDAAVKLDAQTARKFHAILRPKPGEIAELLEHLIARKRWTKEMASIMLDITQKRVADILDGKITDGAVVRLIWLLDKLDREPEFLKNSLFFVTWGKSKGLTPKKDRQRKTPKPPREKFRMPRVLLTNSPWVYVDYSLPRADIAKLLNVTEETVDLNIRKMRRLPKSVLLKAFGAVGRPRQAGILIRGVVKSLNSLIEREDSPKMSAL